MVDTLGPLQTNVPTQNVRAGSATLEAKAEALEATFLTEMLKAAGLGKPLETFGGGVGEDAFSSFLTREYATMLAAEGGIGLAESIVRALTEDGQ